MCSNIGASVLIDDSWFYCHEVYTIMHLKVLFIKYVAPVLSK